MTASHIYLAEQVIYISMMLRYPFNKGIEFLNKSSNLPVVVELVYKNQPVDNFVRLRNRDKRSETKASSEAEVLYPSQTNELQYEPHILCNVSSL